MEILITLVIIDTASNLRKVDTFIYQKQHENTLPDNEIMLENENS